MNSFWGSLYDWAKDRRYAALFLVTLIIFFGLVLLGAVLYLNAGAFNVPLTYVLSWIGVLFIALVWMAPPGAGAP